MITEFGELGIATRLLVILGPALFVIALIFSLRAREFSWPNIAVIGIAMAVLLLPSIQKFTVGKDSVSFELFERGAEKSIEALAALQKGNEDNGRAIAALRDAVSEIRSSYANLIAKQNTAIASVVDKSMPDRPATNPSAEQRSLQDIQSDLTRIDSGITQKLNQAQQSIDALAPINEVGRSKIRDFDTFLRQAK